MSAEPVPQLSATDLAALAQAHRPGACTVCAPLVCPGWESVPSTFDVSSLHRVGTLRGEDAEASTVV